MHPRSIFTAFAAAVLALGSASAAVAAPSADANSRITHPGSDHMGSTIAAHEHAVRPLVDGPTGIDVSSHQGDVDWNAVKAGGASFAYAKATEGTGYTNPNFAQQYNGSYGVGLVRGAYHFALPDSSGGAAQADYFADHGGGWSADNQTLPGLLDIEYNPYGATCYGLSQASMTSWIADFLNEYQARTGRWAVIYTTTDWWTSCTGNAGDFGANDPLFIANYNGSPGTLPAGWGTYTFWQYADSGSLPGDQDVFNGSQDGLVALANG